MFVSRELTGLKSAEAAGIRAELRAGRAVGYGVLMNVQAQSGQLEDLRPRSDVPHVESPGGLLQPGDGVPAHLTYQGIMAAKGKI